MSKKIVKRSLVLSALMAFVITGSAMAADEIAKGSSVEVNSAYTKVIGGDQVYPGDSIPTFTSTGITINGGTVSDYVVGGNKVVGVAGTSTITTTNVTINGGVFDKVTVTTGKGNSGYLFDVVVAGDYLKAQKSNNPAGAINSEIGTTNLTINGGTFNAPVVGGSAVNQFAGTCTPSTANVGVANMTITGGTFSEGIIAGGLSKNGNNNNTGDVISNVGEVNLVINNENAPRINSDIYVGGVKSAIAGNVAVSEAIVDIKDVTVKNLYAYNGVYNTTNTNDFTDNMANQYSVLKPLNGEEGRELSAVNTNLTLTNVKAETVDVAQGSLTLSTAGTGTTEIATLKTTSDVAVAMVADGTATDALNGDAEAFRKNITLTNVNEGFDYTAVEGKMNAGDIVGDVTFKLDAEGNVIDVVEEVHEGNAGVAHNANIALMAWRAETNDMNKRMGELRNDNGEHGVWARMVGGEDEFKNAEYEYTQYQLGYDEKLSVDPSWTVGVALSYTDGESNFGKGSGENTHKGLSVYGTKLNADGSFVDLIAKYSRFEHDLTVDGDQGDYSTNGYSVSAEYGKRFDQGNGLWIEPQVELTYGKVKAAEYKLGNKTVSQDAMESLVGRVGFSLGKDIKDGNVYARASYLYDFEGETNMAFTNGATRNFEYDLGGGWWEVGVGANINLSKATYIYADVEKTFGGEVDTNWQWNLGVRYSF